MHDVMSMHKVHFAVMSKGDVISLSHVLHLKNQTLLKIISAVYLDIVISAVNKRNYILGENKLTFIFLGNKFIIWDNNFICSGNKFGFLIQTAFHTRPY